MFIKFYDGLGIILGVGKLVNEVYILVVKEQERRMMLVFEMRVVVLGQGNFSSGFGCWVFFEV